MNTLNLGSKILIIEKVENQDRKFGSAKEYYPVLVITKSGAKVPALFTRSQLKVALERATKNKEDFQGIL